MGTAYHGDALDVLRTLPDASVDAVVTDPPYGLANTDPAHVAQTITRWVNGERDYLPGGAGFMGKEWDAFVPPVAVWDECLRILKPGGHVLCFAGSRTMDLMTLGLRLAGFEIRDSIAWLYSQGFPKSLDVSKAIDKAAGVEREVIGKGTAGAGFNKIKGFGSGATTKGGEATSEWDVTAPASPEARKWQGWGTALKPAFEPIVVARKPFVGTVAANVLEHGTGALNVDACRVPTSEADKAAINAKHAGMDAATYERRAGVSLNLSANPMPLKPAEAHAAGRWPTNVVLDDTQATELDRQSGASGASRFFPTLRHDPDEEYQCSAGSSDATSIDTSGPIDPTASAAGVSSSAGPAEQLTSTRFRYQAKAPSKERPKVDDVSHPTVKPLELMKWLVRLVGPPGGTVLDPFAGSGTTVEACILEGVDCIAIEREASYLPLIRERVNRAKAKSGPSTPA